MALRARLDQPGYPNGPAGDSHGGGGCVTHALEVVVNDGGQLLLVAVQLLLIPAHAHHGFGVRDRVAEIVVDHRCETLRGRRRGLRGQHREELRGQLTTKRPENRAGRETETEAHVALVGRVETGCTEHGSDDPAVTRAIGDLIGRDHVADRLRGEIRAGSGRDPTDHAHHLARIATTRAAMSALGRVHQVLPARDARARTAGARAVRARDSYMPRVASRVALLPRVRALARGIRLFCAPRALALFRHGPGSWFAAPVGVRDTDPCAIVSHCKQKPSRRFPALSRGMCHRSARFCAILDTSGRSGTRGPQRSGA